jgi:hypothetical protein
MSYPRVRDLPEKEQEPFNKWLYGQTCPVEDDTLPREEWDWYYPWDYTTWKAGNPPLD